jgi:uncharacterized protein with gpF-like domain
MGKTKNIKSRNKGKPLVYPESLKSWTYVESMKLQKETAASFVDNIDGLTSAQKEGEVRKIQEQIEAELNKKIDEFAVIFTQKTHSFVIKGVERSLKDFVKIIPKSLTQEGKKAVMQIYNEFSMLQKSFVGETASKISQAAFENFNNGGKRKELVDKIAEIIEPKMDGAGKRTIRKRAKFIARDQVEKAYSTIAKVKLKEIGIKSFEWFHTGISRKPRELHKKDFKAGGLNHGIFELDKPPTADLKTGEKALPGQLINCSCVITPVLQG